MLHPLAAQDDAHIFCLPDQLADEILQVLELSLYNPLHPFTSPAHPFTLTLSHTLTPSHPHTL